MAFSNLKYSLTRILYKEFKDYGKGINLGIGEVYYKTPLVAANNTIKAIINDETKYASNKGVLELRQAILDFYYRAYKRVIPLDEIIITSGASNALDLALRAILSPGDEVILFGPCYGAIPNLVWLNGGIPVFYNLKIEDNYNIDYDYLKTLISPKTKAIVFNYPNNPTSKVLTEFDLKEIKELLLFHEKLYILSDEVYASINFGNNFPLISGIEENERIIVVNSTSKAFGMTGFRVGYLLAKKEIVDKVEIILQNTLISVNTFAQVGAANMYNYGDSFLREKNMEYIRKRKLIFDELINTDLNFLIPEGGFYVFLDLRSYTNDSMQFAFDLLRKYFVYVVPGIEFGSEYDGFIRLSFATSYPELKEGLKEIKKYLKTLERK